MLKPYLYILESPKSMIFILKSRSSYVSVPRSMMFSNWFALFKEMSCKIMNLATFITQVQTALLVD